VEVTPILNVSELQASFEWFAKLGWEKGWDWCPPDADPPPSALSRRTITRSSSAWTDKEDAASTESGSRCGSTTSTQCMRPCAREGFDVISAPENKPWNVREMHVRHPDGHVLRVSSEATHEHQ